MSGPTKQTLEQPLCPDCGRSWGDDAPPEVSYQDACWIALRLLTIMGKGYANGTEEEQDAIRLVGELLWDHMLYGAEQAGKKKRRVRK